MLLSDIVIILCRVSEPGNVGAVCRAMKNMGLSRLRLVSPAPSCCPGSPEEGLIRARAVHAGELWDNALFFDTLSEAAADCSLLAGTTRRRGRRRKNITMDPHTLATWLSQRRWEKTAAAQPTAAQPTAPVAVVFGNERTGLEDAELDLCNIASHIPVSDSFPSLNLSHAVQIYAYELSLALSSTLPSTLPEADGTEPGGNAVKGEWTPLNRAHVDELTGSITNTLAGLGFYKHPGREEQTRFLRDLISRAGLTEKEGRYLKDIFAKAARMGSNGL
ncbi:tRNA (cytidine/uridine-2'-O-)-methyltransferase TrmJ [Spirochaetia bacterium]|nr:tRNA (cytidine/uridine-2'-O-)-methyltransferase TrmJ [Spirochaetia bacterium]